MQTYSRIYTSQAPHVIGQEVLLEYAIDDFLRRVTRLKPWYRARYDALLTDLNQHFDQLLRRATPLAAFTDPLIEHWLDTRYPDKVAAQMLKEFKQYLLEWNWVREGQFEVL